MYKIFTRGAISTADTRLAQQSEGRFELAANLAGNFAS